VVLLLKPGDTSGSGPRSNSDGTISLYDLQRIKFKQDKANRLNYRRQKKLSGMSNKQYDSYFDEY